MRKSLVLSLFIVFMIASGTVSAQYFEKMVFIGWNANTPLVNKDFAGKSSSRGARLGYRQLIQEKVALGVDVVWATYEDYVPRRTYVSNGSALTTDFTNFANTYGVMLTGDYYFFEEKKVMPYVGLGAGVGYNSYNRYYNVYAANDSKFGFMARPTAGAWIKFSERKNWGLNAAVHYDFSTAKSERYGYNNFMNVGFELGLVFLSW